MNLNNRTKEEMYRHLSIEVRDEMDWSVEKGLQQFFGVDTLELKCEKCKAGNSATQCIQVISR